LLGKLGQIQGFVAGAKTKSRDQVCRDCRDLVFAGIKKRQSHRETRPNQQRASNSSNQAKARTLRQAQAGMRWFLSQFYLKLRGAFPWGLARLSPPLRARRLGPIIAERLDSPPASRNQAWVSAFSQW